MEPHTYVVFTPPCKRNVDTIMLRFTRPAQSRSSCGSDSAPPELHLSCIVEVEGGGVTPLQPAKKLLQPSGLLFGFWGGRQSSSIVRFSRRNAGQVEVLCAFTICLCEVGGAGCLFASTQLKETTAKRGAGFLCTKTVLTCVFSLRRGGGTRSCFIFGLVRAAGYS